MSAVSPVKQLLSTAPFNHLAPEVLAQIEEESELVRYELGARLPLRRHLRAAVLWGADTGRPARKAAQLHPGQVAGLHICARRRHDVSPVLAVLAVLAVLTVLAVEADLHAPRAHHVHVTRQCLLSN